MPGLQISLLGPFQVRLNGDVVSSFATNKVQGLLAYLAVESGYPHRRETLAGLLWPEQLESAARQNLRQTLLRLRHALPGDTLQTTRQTVQLNPGIDLRLDVQIFTELIDICQSHQHSELTVCLDCIARLESAVDLYRGDFLAHFFLEDAFAFEEWSVLKREWLRRQALHALYHLSAHFDQQGEYDDALHYGWRQVELDSLREEAHQQVMHALALSGRRSEALAQHDSCRRILAEELGVEPTAETETLHERIRDNRLGEENSVVIRARRRAPALQHNLPLQSTPFIGRESELAELARLLDDPELRLITILGQGGMGKTRLALEGASPQVGRFTDGIYFVPLATIKSPDIVASAVAEVLDLSFYEGGTPQQQLLDYVRSKNILLVMDNFEHLLAATAFVIDLLRVAPDLKILTTSRAGLNVQGEQLLLIGGMDFPEGDHETAQDATLSSSVQLFLQGARRIRSKFELTTENLTHVVLICQLVQGMPLGVLLAAAWVELLAPAEIAAQIRQNLDFLETDLRDVPERQQSLRTVFDHSWILLSQRERELFQRLSLFRGGFTWQAAQAVTEASLRELRALVSKSLLQSMPSGRYEVHELLRQYVADKLDQTEHAGKVARDRHSAHFAAASQQWALDLKSSRQQATLAEIEADIENARMAWNWALENGNLARMAQTLDGLCHFFDLRVRLQEGEALCSLAVAQLSAAARVTTTQSDRKSLLLVRLLAWQGLFSRASGNLEVASQLLRQGLNLVDGPALAGQDVRAERAFIFFQMAETVRDSNRQSAQQFYQQSVALYRALGDRWTIATVLAALGSTLRKLGFRDEAKQILEESLALRQAIGDQIGSAESLIWLGWVMVGTEQQEEGARLIRKGNAILQEFGDRANRAYGNHELGKYIIWRGHLSEANHLLEKGLETYSDLGSRKGVAESSLWLGIAKRNLGQYDEAKALLEMSVPFFREVGELAPLGYTLYNLGLVAMAEEQFSEAGRLLQESVRMGREMGERDQEGVTFAYLGCVAHRLGNISQAQQYLAHALRSGIETKYMPSLWHGLFPLALLQAERGNLERAIELYALATEKFAHLATSRWADDVFGRHITAIAATSPPEVVIAAQERGKALDLWTTAEELLVEMEDWA